MGVRVVILAGMLFGGIFLIAMSFAPGYIIALFLMFMAGWRVGFLLLGIFAIVFGILSFILYRTPPKDGALISSIISRRKLSPSGS